VTVKILLGLTGLFIAPLLGGLIAGLDRRLTARLQSRIGPPIRQPFYDVLKLLGKDAGLITPWQSFCSLIYLTAAAMTVVFFFMGSDLLLIFFIQGTGAVFLVVGALSAPSPYSQVGAHRELIQILTYEPLLLLVIIGLYSATGTFMVRDIYQAEKPLLIKLPLLFIVLGYVLTIKLRKSPFDISASHHAHQEIVRGVLTEYSGPALAWLEIGHWFETIFILAVCTLFWGTSITGMVILVALTYLMEILLDNITARLTWRWMLKSLIAVGIPLSLANLLWLYFG
jgi:ech hydrogenase subunit B